MEDGYATIFFGADYLEVTSRRKGFAGGGFEGGPGLPKLMATAAGIPGASSIPHGSELFLGFTSTPKEKSGRERIVNLETLGYVDLGPGQYFRHGTHMHLSHLYEDLEAWYGRSSHAGRVASMFRPGLAVAEGKQTLAEGPAQTESAADVVRDAHATASSGTSARSSRHPGSSIRSSARTASTTGSGRRSRTAPISTRSTARSRSARTRRATG